MIVVPDGYAAARHDEVGLPRSVAQRAPEIVRGVADDAERDRRGAGGARGRRERVAVRVPDLDRKSVV